MDLQEDGTPYRTMIEVIVKFLTTSASRKASYTATSTKISNPKEGVADSTARKKGGACKTPTSDVPRLAEGSSPSDSKKNKVHQDVDTQIATSKMGSLSISQYGKPITKSLATNPITHELSHSHLTPSRLSEASESTPSHLNKPTYPQTEPSSLRESAGQGLTIKPGKHSTSILQKDKTSVVSVKPREDVHIQPSSRQSGGGVIINVASGHTISPQSASNTRSSARGVVKSGHTSLASRETCTLRSDSRAESVKQKPHYGRHAYTCKDSSRNKEVTATDDKVIDSNTTLVADCKL